MKHGFLALVCLMVALVPCRGALAEPAGPGLGPDVTVRLASGRVAIEARQVPVRQVIAALAREAGFRLTLAEGLDDTPGNWSLHDVPLAAAVSQLVSPYGDMALVFQDASSPNPSPPAISALYVAPRSAHRPARAAPDPSSIPAPEQRGRSLVRLILAQGELATRAQAVRDLLALPDAQAETLGEALSVPEPVLREEIARALGQMGGDAALLVLGQTLLGDPAQEVRLVAAEALAALDDPRAWLLLRQAADDPDEAVRGVIADSLRGRD